MRELIFTDNCYPGHKKENMKLLPESCTGYCSEAQKALSLKGGWSNFDSQAYCLYEENQNCETAFKDKVLQATVDGWCKIQVIYTKIITIKDYHFYQSNRIF